MKSSAHRQSPSVRPDLKAAGFTLIEALSAMTIAAILMAIAVPSFRYVTTANRMSSDINGLLGDLQFARAEAIKQGLPVTVCATDDAATCKNDVNAWKTGWLVFVDNNGSGTIDPSDTILRVQKPFSNGEQLQTATLSAITFNREGFVSNAPGAVTMTLRDATSNAQYTRCLSFTFIGAMSTQIAGKQTAGGVLCGP